MALVIDLSGNAPLNANSRDLHIVSNKQGHAISAVAVTPSDAVNLVGGNTHGISCDNGGDVAMIMSDGVLVTATLNTGEFYPYQIKRVNNTNTTATGIKAYY